MTRLQKTLLPFVLVTFAAAAASRAEDSAPSKILDKTMVVWAVSDDPSQSGGSALTIDQANPDAFDAVVFGELRRGVWMPGSSFYKRTCQDQAAWPREDPDSQELVRLAIVYRGRMVDFYRGDALVASYEIPGERQVFDENAVIFFGPRHDQNQADTFVGKIRDARIYPTALTAEQIASLEPGKELSGVTPWVWWDFTATGLYERCGRFNDILLKGDAALADGLLVLGPKKGALSARCSRGESSAAAVPSAWTIDGPVPNAVLASSRLLREKFLADPFRPRWHFVCPEDKGMPGDSNGCFWANGAYHLMYLYERADSGFCWGHLSSTDLVHWRHHPDSLGVGDGDEGCFSGGGFLDDDGTAYLSYWMLWGALGIGMAKSNDPDYEHWTKLASNPVIRSTEFGITELDTADGKLLYGTADPSNIWKKDGKYYILTGNLLVLNKYGRAEDSPQDMRGDRLYLFEATRLGDDPDWRYKGVFYQRQSRWTDDSEDNMCPSFLPLARSKEGGELSDKYLLLFISHNKGCQYYIGTLNEAGDRFLPERHGRMTWVDNTYFAPEALIDGRGRQIMWSWLLDNRGGENDRSGGGMINGWTGAYGLPRQLWLGDDDTLRMCPVPEIETLRADEKTLENVTLDPDHPLELTGFPGDSFDLEVTISAEELKKTGRFGLIVREDAEADERTILCYEKTPTTDDNDMTKTVDQSLVFDSTRGGSAGRPAREAAPLRLPEGEDLTLRVLVDRPVIELYANDRQGIGRRVFPTNPDRAQGVSLFSDSPVTVKSVRSWKMNPANPY